MYIISFLVVVIASLLTMGTFVEVIGDWSGVYLYLDIWSFAILIVLCIPILIGSGLFKDFNNAFRLAVKIKTKTDAVQKTEKKGGREVTLPEVKHAIEAVILVRKVLIAGGTFIVLLTFSFLLQYLSEDAFGRNVAVAILPLTYAFAADIFLLPVEARLKVRLNDMIHQ